MYCRPIKRTDLSTGPKIFNRIQCGPHKNTLLKEKKNFLQQMFAEKVHNNNIYAKFISLRLEWKPYFIFYFLFSFNCPIILVCWGCKNKESNSAHLAFLMCSVLMYIVHDPFAYTYCKLCHKSVKLVLYTLRRWIKHISNTFINIYEKLTWRHIY